MAAAQSSLFGQYKFNWVGRGRREEGTNLVGVEFRGVGKREVNMINIYCMPLSKN